MEHKYLIILIGQYKSFMMYNDKILYVYDNDDVYDLDND